MKNNKNRAFEKYISIPQPLWDEIIEAIIKMNKYYEYPKVIRENLDTINKKLKEYGFELK